MGVLIYIRFYFSMKSVLVHGRFHGLFFVKDCLEVQRSEPIKSVFKGIVLIFSHVFFVCGSINEGVSIIQVFRTSVDHALRRFEILKFKLITRS